MASNHKKLMQLISTMYTLSRYMPMPADSTEIDELLSHYHGAKDDESIDKQIEEDGTIKELERDIKKFTRRWLNTVSEDDIIAMKQDLIFKKRQLC